MPIAIGTNTPYISVARVLMKKVWLPTPTYVISVIKERGGVPKGPSLDSLAIYTLNKITFSIGYWL